EQHHVVLAPAGGVGVGVDLRLQIVLDVGQRTGERREVAVLGNLETGGVRHRVELAQHLEDRAAGGEGPALHRVRSRQPLEGDCGGDVVGQQAPPTVPPGGHGGGYGGEAGRVVGRRPLVRVLIAAAGAGVELL